MKNLKKFFAFSIATAMVAGAVWAGTPAFRAVAGSLKYWAYNTNTGEYVDVSERKDRTTIYTEAPYKLYEQKDSNYTQITKNSEDKVESVVINEVYRYVYLGDNPRFTATVRHTDSKKDNDMVNWTSLTPEIATISEIGVVTPIKVGEATIVATSQEDSNHRDSFTFKVVNKPTQLKFKNIDTEKGLTIKVGDTLELQVEGADAYSSEKYDYEWDVRSSSDTDAKIATMSENGKLTGKAKGKGYISLYITEVLGTGDARQPVVAAYASCKLEVVEPAPATDPNAPTSEERAKQEQTPESIANYQNWLATYGGGDAAAAPVGVTAVSGEVGQPGSEAIVNTGTGEPVAMFQSNDTTNTLLAAPVGVVPSGTKIETVEAGKDTPAFKAVQNKLSRISRRGTVQKVYGIAGLNPDGSLMTLINGKAAMSMPMPTDITVPAGRSLKVYLIDDNGQTTKLDTAVDQGRVVFEIPKFGTFAFVVE